MKGSHVTWCQLTMPDLLKKITLVHENIQFKSENHYELNDISTAGAKIKKKTFLNAACSNSLLLLDFTPSFLTANKLKIVIIIKKILTIKPCKTKWFTTNIINT